MVTSLTRGVPYWFTAPGIFLTFLAAGGISRQAGRVQRVNSGTGWPLFAVNDHEALQLRPPRLAGNQQSPGALVIGAGPLVKRYTGVHITQPAKRDSGSVRRIGMRRGRGRPDVT
jgi:hypothetical protein